MSQIVYTPTRNLVSGSTGIINIDFSQCDRALRAEGKKHRAISGLRSGVLYRNEKEWSLKTQLIDPSMLPYFREFSESCSNVETFDLDITDVEGGPSTTINCYLKENSYSETRFNSFSFIVSFRAIEI